ncbi:MULTISPECIES: acyl-CoA dehydrogenase family protein [unclassified Streptomyces]|uniref:acyl-CoA dehydrogenase family protein n=1 Tax=unclassified Streptomyces TaxID=2593676 RepID=UPI0023665BBD|nr:MULTISPECIES: acyl-CoA dehydrogenase family protein [unclassified Streptomyces]MDF3142784.1 acyl-CoA/acyl-ACP dehydrogenase [Streptomyces sp. T21Q-yed]WDF42869.1 acyl-CoA/acyl-ACP dehydrogenase [Streptomyces sp. T12]
MSSASRLVDSAEFVTWLEGFRTWAAKGADDDGAWQTAAEQGLLSLTLPVEHGGTGAGHLATCLAMEAMADASGRSGLPFALSAHLWACQEPIAAFADAEQRSTYLTPLSSGTAVGAFAATEYDAGSDLLSLTTRAEPHGDGGWRLDGAKTFVTNGPVADVFLVLARTAEGSALSGLSAFLIPRETPGLSVGPDFEKAGLPGAQLGSLRLDDCVLPASAVLGPVGGGYAVLMRAMRYERAFILAPVLGLMSRALREAVEHVRTRSQFGRPLSTYDTIRRRVVRMHLSITSAREILHATALAADRGELDHARASLTKLHVSNEFNAFCQELPDVYGGYALFPETGAAQLMSDAIASRYYSGTSDMQMKIIAEGLGL